MAAEHVQALGERIRLRREELGMTQDEVARQMKGTVDGQRISKWERGENRPRDESLEDLARVLKTTAIALLMPAPDKTSTPDLSRDAGRDALADRFDQIERHVTDQLAKHAEEVEAQLGSQNETLAEMKATLAEIREGIKTEQQAKRDAQAAVQEMRDLLAALAVAIPALTGASQRTAEAPEPRAT